MLELFQIKKQFTLSRIKPFEDSMGGSETLIRMYSVTVCILRKGSLKTNLVTTVSSFYFL